MVITFHNILLFYCIFDEQKRLILNTLNKSYQPQTFKQYILEFPVNF